MAYLRAFGSCLPPRIVDNAEIAALVGVDPAWILQVSGIEQRRFAAPADTLEDLGARAASACLDAAGIPASAPGLILVSSGSAPRRFPGPATAIAAALGLDATPAIDLPLASAGSLFALSLAANLTHTYGHVLVVATEIMSRTVRLDPAGRDTAILFGDGAGACLVSPDSGFARIADSVIHSDGGFAASLRLDLDAPIHMDGRTIILQVARKLPRVILEVLERNRLDPAAVGAYLLHQANLNLITRVAQSLGVPESHFFRNLGRYGNTSSASLLIAADEWWRETGAVDSPVVLAAFGAGLNWGALLAMPV